MKTFVVLGLLVLLSFNGSSGAENGDPKTLRELNAEYVEPPVGSNAATVYLESFSALKITKADENSPHLPLIGKGTLPSGDKPVPPQMQAAIADFVRRNEQAIGLLDKAAAVEACRYPIDLTKGEATLLPHLAKIKRAAQVLELAAISQAANRDGKRAGESIICILKLADSLRNEPTTISQLVRIACVNLAVTGLEQTGAVKSG